MIDLYNSPLQFIVKTNHLDLPLRFTSKIQRLKSLLNCDASTNLHDSAQQLTALIHS
jgi:hypothetical protein